MGLSVLPKCLQVLFLLFCVNSVQSVTTAGCILSKQLTDDLSMEFTATIKLEFCRGTYEILKDRHFMKGNPTPLGEEMHE